MWKSCSIAAGSFLVLGGVYYYVLRTVIPFPGNLFLTFFCSLGAVFFVSAIYQLLSGNNEVDAVRRFQRGEPPSDGKLVAVSGAIYADSAPILSPFQGVPCVAYSYEIRPRGRSEDSSGADAMGFAMVPSSIRTPLGSVRLRSFTMLTEFPERDCFGPEPTRNAGRYLETAPFEDIKDGAFSKISSLASDLLIGESGTLRRDLRMSHPASLSDRDLVERRVEEGMEVTALGLYGIDVGGIKPGMSAGVATKLFPLGPEKTLKRLRREQRTALIIGTVFFFFSHGLAAFLLLANR